MPRKGHLKIRQPLAKAVVFCGENAKFNSESVQMISEELNVKFVEFVTEPSLLSTTSLRPNFKVLKPKFGAQMRDAIAAVNALSAEQAYSLSCHNDIMVSSEITLTYDDVLIDRAPKEGLVVETEGDLIVGLETALTPELIAEGNAREFVSHVQSMRKEADFEVTQRIVIAVEADAEMKAALEAHLDYVKNETLATEVTIAEGAGDVDLNGHKTGIEVEKA